MSREQTYTTPTLPLSEADTLRIERNVLLAEVVELRQIKAAAEYVVGPSGCVEDRDCDEYWPEDGEPLPPVELCSHLRLCHATFGDVRAREGLEALVSTVLQLIDKCEDGIGAQIREEIHAAVDGLTARLAETEPGRDYLDREPYKTVADEAHVETVLAGIEAATRRENGVG